MSKDEYEISDVDEYGLAAKRTHRFCSTSLDGGQCLYRKNSQGGKDLLGYSALEMKTKGKEGTATKLLEQVANRGEFEKASFQVSIDI